MAIRQIVPGTKLMPLSGMASVVKTQTFKTQDLIGIPTTLFEECIGSLVVFGDLTSDDTLKNDFKRVLTLQFPGNTIQHFLLDENCNEIAELNDSTYGINFPLGFLPITDFTFFQTRYIGYQIDWKKVLTINGPGVYQIKTKKTPSVGEIEEQFSCLYEVCQFTEDRANGTVRIEVTQNGKIISEGLNYLGTNWKQQYRLPGFFGHIQRRLEQNEYLDKNRTTTQIQDTLIHEFTLTPELLPACLRPILDQILLANEILISDYNLENTDDLKNISVRLRSIDSEYFGKSPKVADEIKFEERQKDRIKRNVK